MPHISGVRTKCLKMHYHLLSRCIGDSFPSRSFCMICCNKAFASCLSPGRLCFNRVMACIIFLRSDRLGYYSPAVIRALSLCRIALVVRKQYRHFLLPGCQIIHEAIPTLPEIEIKCFFLLLSTMNIVKNKTGTQITAT